jgi:hypothetical protein
MPCKRPTDGRIDLQDPERNPDYRVSIHRRRSNRRSQMAYMVRLGLWGVGTSSGGFKSSCGKLIRRRYNGNGQSDRKPWHVLSGSIFHLSSEWQGR